MLSSISNTHPFALSCDPQAAMLCNIEPLDQGVWPDVGPLRSTRAALAAACDVLQV